MQGVVGQSPRSQISHAYSVASRDKSHGLVKGRRRLVALCVLAFVLTERVLLRYVPHLMNDPRVTMKFDVPAYKYEQSGRIKVVGTMFWGGLMVAALLCFRIHAGPRFVCTVCRNCMRRRLGRVLDYRGMSRLPAFLCGCASFFDIALAKEYHKFLAIASVASRADIALLRASFIIGLGSDREGATQNEAMPRRQDLEKMSGHRAFVEVPTRYFWRVWRSYLEVCRSDVMQFIGEVRQSFAADQKCKRWLTVLQGNDFWGTCCFLVNLNLLAEACLGVAFLLGWRGSLDVSLDEDGICLLAVLYKLYVSLVCLPFIHFASSWEIVAVSYLWLTPQNPDPQGVQLRFLAQALALYENSLKPSCTLCVFLDYMSAYQHDSIYSDCKIIEVIANGNSLSYKVQLTNGGRETFCVSGKLLRPQNYERHEIEPTGIGHQVESDPDVDVSTGVFAVGSGCEVRKPRSKGEEKSFRRCLTGGTINLLYGSSCTNVWMMTKVPEYSQRDYNKSGWCFMEKGISAVTTRRASLLDLGRVYDSIKELPDWKHVTDRCAYGGKHGAEVVPMPVTPQKFQEQLEDKRFVNGSDKETVQFIYKKNYKLAIQLVRKLNFGHSGWGDDDMHDLAAVLEDCRALLILKLHNNPRITERGLRILLKAESFSRLVGLTLYGTSVPKEFERELRQCCTKLTVLQWESEDQGTMSQADRILRSGADRDWIEPTPPAVDPSGEEVRHQTEECRVPVPNDESV